MKNNEMEVEFVLVYLGKNLPKYLFENIEHITGLFPNININLVISAENRRERIKFNGVNVVFYHPTKEINDLFESRIKDASFRNGFWRYSLERLFSIEQLHFAKPTKGFLHLESDILLLPGFPISVFSNLTQIHWLAADYETDSAGIIYFPGPQFTKEFTLDLSGYLQKSLNPSDMKGLRYLREKYPDRYRLLPTGNLDFPKLTKRNQIAPQPPNNYFEGIFDAAAIGMWLTGIDPRNAYGLKKYFDTNYLNSMKSNIDPSAYKILLSKSRKMYFVNKNKLLPIYNLHIHSKSRKILSKNWISELPILVNQSDKHIVKTEFYPMVLAKLILENALKRTFIAFVYNSPMFKPLRGLMNVIRES